MPNKATLLFETAEGKRDYVSVEIKGSPVQVNASVAELKQENRPTLTARIRREISAMADREHFSSQASYDDMVNKTANQIIAVLDELADKTDGLKAKRNDQGHITESLVHKSLGEQERRVLGVLHDPAKFRAPFIVEIANRENLRFIITEKDCIRSIIPAGQRDPYVEARTMRYNDPKTDERMLQQIYISTHGKADNTALIAGSSGSSQDKLVNGFAHETIHNTKLDKIFSGRIEKGEAAQVDKLISEDIKHLDAVDTQLKHALTLSSANPAQSFADIAKAAELNGKLAPLFELALEGFDKRTMHSSALHAHDLREAVKNNAIPSTLPEGLTAQDYADGVKDVVRSMSEHMILPVRFMHYFPADRYPDRKAVLNEYPGQVFSLMALKGIAVTECLLPHLTPLLCDAVKADYSIDPKNFTLSETLKTQRQK